MLLFTFCPTILELRHWVPSPILGLGRLFWFSLASSSSLLEREKVVNAKKITVHVVKDKTYAAVKWKPEKIQANRESIHDRIQVQCYNHSKPTGNWSFNWFVIIPRKDKDKNNNEYMKFTFHYFITELNWHFSLSIFLRQFILLAWEFTYSG